MSENNELLLRLEIFKFQMGSALDFANYTIRYMLFLNGGAAISLLALLGYLHGDPEYEISNSFKFAVLFFGLGAFSSVVTAFCAYACQYHVASSDMALIEVRDEEGLHEQNIKLALVDKYHRYGYRYQFLAVYMAFVSCIFFLTGLLNSYSGF